MANPMPFKPLEIATYYATKYNLEYLKQQLQQKREVINLVVK
jgi:hypothetical protein